jgi:hypothetical protein
MEPIISTPRLKLTLITTAERESPELEWLHEIRSDEKATWWRYLEITSSTPPFHSHSVYFSVTPSTWFNSSLDHET